MEVTVGDTGDLDLSCFHCHHIRSGMKPKRRNWGKQLGGHIP